MSITQLLIQCKWTCFSACHQQHYCWLNVNDTASSSMSITLLCGLSSKTLLLAQCQRHSFLFNLDGMQLIATLQMKSRWESNINVWLRFMYSQKWNCAASLFTKQNYNVLSPNFHIHVSVSDLCIPRTGLPNLMQSNKQTDNINRSQIHECGNWEQGRPVSFLGIHKSDFR
jgi:hypothetical protein